MSIIRSCTDAWLKTATRCTDMVRAQPEQQAAHRAQNAPLRHTPQAGAKKAVGEASHNSSAVRSFCTGPSTRSGTHRLALPVAPAGCVPCDAEARREASGGVCSFFRKSKRFTVNNAYLALQRILGPNAQTLYRLYATLAIPNTALAPSAVFSRYVASADRDIMCGGHGKLQTKRKYGIQHS